MEGYDSCAQLVHAFCAAMVTDDCEGCERDRGLVADLRAVDLAIVEAPKPAQSARF